MTPNERLLIEELLDSAETPMGPLLERVRALVDAYNALCGQKRDDALIGNRERLLAALDEDRDVLLMALSDACLDEGREAEAKGWGWLASRRLWPCRQGSTWVWYSADEFVGSPDCDVLPGPLYEEVHHQFRTPRTALEAVVSAITEGRWKPSDKRKER